ncbi:WAP four-disulfide core domain protein 1 isoform X2 [Macaca mulatta]
MRKTEEAGAPGGSRQPRADRCPPPPRTMPPGACQAVRCQADSECPRHRRCCYNGCAYACLEAVPPPPVLDWLVQPKPRWLGGNGWLLDGPEEVLQGTCRVKPRPYVRAWIPPSQLLPESWQHQAGCPPCVGPSAKHSAVFDPPHPSAEGLMAGGSARIKAQDRIRASTLLKNEASSWMTPACVPPTAEACSTTEDGAEPLLCPSGYECHILSPGDVAEGIPNRGQCVKQRRQADGRILRHKLYKEYPEGDSKNVAEPGRGQQRYFQ